MANRDERARIASETLAIIERGTYVAPLGRKVEVKDAVRDSIEASALITPDQWESIRERARLAMSGRSFATVFEVRNETTLSAARRLVERVGSERAAALNFASAKNPGGGFMGGAQAQEESLARASALHASLVRHERYYAANRHAPSLLYTDHMIVSPRVPVFRDDADRLLEEPWRLTMITAPAPNAGAIARSERQSLGKIEPTFRRRIEQVLSAAVTFDQTALVLGAWGCGVFGNDPDMVARLFGEFLLNDGAFARAFEHVAFAVLDRQGRSIRAFSDLFGPVSDAGGGGA